ncbi:hypothetical protein RN001_010201 [Aquatica leii]|uniref:Craniofacial development protein 2-like n=1 Tax=Aquatica leii TaxID=1421715 RepID=A0AAN7SQ79_9COLE|nr:hypothetical protein RN001_010201 [Aquatica leii]
MHNKKEKAKYINKWTSITARILHIEMDIEKHNKTSILVVYGPDENETAKVKDEFWNQLTEIIEAIKGRLIIIGDINGRVGKRNEESGACARIRIPPLRPTKSTTNHKSLQTGGPLSAERMANPSRMRCQCAPHCVGQHGHQQKR